MPSVCQKISILPRSLSCPSSDSILYCGLSYIESRFNSLAWSLSCGMMNGDAVHTCHMSSVSEGVNFSIARPRQWFNDWISNFTESKQAFTTHSAQHIIFDLLDSGERNGTFLAKDFSISISAMASRLISLFGAENGCFSYGIHSSRIPPSGHAFHLAEFIRNPDSEQRSPDIDLELPLISKPWPSQEEQSM